MSEPGHDLLAQLDQIHDQAKEGFKDEFLRHRLYEGARRLFLALETPLDTVRRISFSPLELAVGKIACDLGIFDILSKDDSAMTLDELAVATEVDKSLLTRVLRYLAAVDMIAENPGPAFRATEKTRTLSNPRFKAGLEHQ